jgi:hypothetical protein
MFLAVCVHFYSYVYVVTRYKNSYVLNYSLLQVNKLQLA